MTKSVPTTRKQPKGQGGRRKGYAAANEIEDMRLFDEVPGKEPSQENGAPPADLEDEEEIKPTARTERGHHEQQE